MAADDFFLSASVRQNMFFPCPSKKSHLVDPRERRTVLCMILLLLLASTSTTTLPLSLASPYYRVKCLTAGGLRFQVLVNCSKYFTLAAAESKMIHFAFMMTFLFLFLFV